MIVRTEFLRFRERPRPVYYPIMLSVPGVGPKEFDPRDILSQTQRLTFTPETMEEVYFSNIYVNEEDVPYLWKCESCICGSGNYRNVFKTDYEKFENLHNGSPSEKQMNQISEHARQHEIIWSWARSLK